MAHASALPEPTRVDRQDFDGSGPSSARTARDENDFSSLGQPMMPAFQYSNDELAVLAENFFHQRPESGANVDDWWNIGNL